MTEKPQVGVGVIIIRDGRLLMERRAHVLGEGCWSTPGGHLDFGETPEQCAIRETEEEVGMKIAAARFVALTNDYFENEGKHYITIWMQAEGVEGTPTIKAAYEMDSIQWFPLDALPEPLFLSFHDLKSGSSLPQNAWQELVLH
jgi:8-oxo-dGTP diphosphatase